MTVGVGVVDLVEPHQVDGEPLDRALAGGEVDLDIDVVGAPR
jgi:hypothetical protein